jgi:hypothetical protein
MTIEICMRCGRTRDDADDLAFDDEWMPIFGSSGRREDVVCAGCALPQDQAVLERWIDAFDKDAARKAALAAAAHTRDEPMPASVLQAHEYFGELFVGVDLQKCNVSQVDHWITAWTAYNELVRLPASDPSVRTRAIDLTRVLLALERAGVAREGTAAALGFAYGVTRADLGAGT